MPEPKRKLTSDDFLPLACVLALLLFVALIAIDKYVHPLFRGDHG